MRTDAAAEPAVATIAAKVPRAVVDRLRAVARTHDRTLSGQVRRVLREWAERANDAPSSRRRHVE